MNQKNDVIALYSSLRSFPKSIVIDGSSLRLNEILAVGRSQPDVNFSKNSKVISRLTKCHQKLIEQVKQGVPIYGCNTGYGERASVIVNKGTAEQRLDLSRKVSEGISHIDVSVGPTFEDDVVRAAMLIRINMLMAGVSAVKIADLDIYRQMLNKGITPVVNQYGGIGASGDLAHNCRVLSAARWITGTKVKDKRGNIGSAASILKKAKIEKLKLDPKAGLGLVNGDNFSTALATLIFSDTLDAMMLSFVVEAMVIEALLGTDRSFHPLLSRVRPHEGQKEVSSIVRLLLKDSKLAFQEMRGHKLREPGVKVQDGYSLRCLAQYQGVDLERLMQIAEVIEINANSVSDNPLWVTPEDVTEGEDPWQWVSGGNFLAMHMVEAMDSLRKIQTHITKINDRHLARLVSPGQNNGLPANLSMDEAITHCAFKGVQIQSGMFDVYSSLLSMPVSTFFGVHEEGNQDITSHALTSGILGLENLKIARYSLAQNLLAAFQAIHLRGGDKYMSPLTKKLFAFIDGKVKVVKKERPLHNEIETIYKLIVDKKINTVLDEIYAEIKI